MNDTTIWNIENFFSTKGNYAVMILNTDNQDTNLQNYFDFWCKARIRICVDGGTNIYHKQFSNLECRPSKKSLRNDDILPHIISGDFDSINPTLLKLYESLGVKIVHTPSQDETDFTKSLYVLEDYLQSNDLTIDRLIVFTAIGSTRFDHTISQINTLHKVPSILTVPVLINSEPTLLWLLGPGDHEIVVPQRIKDLKDKSWCSLSPIKNYSYITTTGLKWNMTKSLCVFGGLVSTSNTYSENDENVNITCSHPVLWSMGWQYLPEEREENMEIKPQGLICSSNGTS